MSKQAKDVKISKAKGRPMLTWVGKKSLSRVKAYPAQHIESLSVEAPKDALADCDWSDWPEKFPKGGLLFHGDNKDVLAYLLANGFRSKVKLIYIDPPFDSGANYVRKVQLRGKSDIQKIDGDQYTLKEQLQYTDIWTNDTYLQFIYERLLLLKELLRDGGSIFVHCDERKSHHIRCLLDEIFGTENFQNEIIWFYSNKYGANSQTFDAFHNTIFWYSNGRVETYNNIRVPVKEKRKQPIRRWNKELGKNEWLRDKDGNNLYQESADKDVGDVWEIPVINPMALERTDYPTQKPEKLLEYVIECSTNPGDIVLDAFCGSGTTPTVAQGRSRRWIGCDINKGAMQTSAARLNTLTKNVIN